MCLHVPEDLSASIGFRFLDIEINLFRVEFKKMDFPGPEIGSLLQHCTKQAIQEKDPFCGN
jgi:hypothetical protein